MKISELKNDKEKIKKIVVLLKERYHISSRKVAIAVGTSKDIIRRIYNK